MAGFFAPLARRRVHALGSLPCSGEEVVWEAYSDGSGLAVSTITSHPRVVFRALMELPDVKRSKPELSRVSSDRLGRRA